MALIHIIQYRMLTLILVVMSIKSYTQTLRYFDKIHDAELLVKEKKYALAIEVYSQAFDMAGSKIIAEDYFNAACASALSERPDKAFHYLQILSAENHFKDYERLLNDSDLSSLKCSSRWNKIIEQVRTNEETAAKKYDMKLKMQLDSVYQKDQQYRSMYADYVKKYGLRSTEVSDLRDKMSETDDFNLVIVRSILDSHGWLGEDIVGAKGAMALFLVIQHTDNDPDLQIKYCGMFKQAIRSGVSTDVSHLAYLEDRIAVNTRKLQIYGTQLQKDSNGRIIPYPVQDSLNVDRRRAGVGLPPLKYYLEAAGANE